MTPTPTRMFAAVAVAVAVAFCAPAAAAAAPAADPAETPSAAPTRQPAEPPTGQPSGGEPAPPAGLRPRTGAPVPHQDALPDLRITAAFDRPSYGSGDVIGFHVVVTNEGTAPATGVHGWSHGDVFIDSGQWGELSLLGPGMRIEPGQSVPLTLSNPLSVVDGTINQEFRVTGAEPDADESDNWVGIEAPVTATWGTFAGTVYGDGNRSGTFDPGEGLAGVIIELRTQGHGGSHERTTDATGRFAFEDIPTGRYFYSMILPAGWIAPPGEVVVDELDDPDTFVRATRPLSETLSATIEFTEQTYAPGDTAHLTVTLTNSGPVNLRGIAALCTGPGNGNEIYDDPEGWGRLSHLHDDAGVTVPARRSRTFEVTSTVPERALYYGVVSVWCEFGDPVGLQGNPTAEDEARVPGATGTAGGVLIHDQDGDGHDEGEGVPGTKVVLLDEDTGAVVARSVTGATGRFLFAGVPAGRYELRVVGRWKVLHDNPFPVHGDADERGHEVYVVPGPLQPDPDEVPPGETPQDEPDPQGSAPARTGGLATTGAAVTGLLLAGLAAVGAGGVTVVLARRRPGASTT